MDLKLSSTGDIDITGGVITLATGVDAIAQDVRGRLLFFLGEWFLDTRLGVDWFGKVLVKRPTESIVHAMLRDVIEHTPGIKQITDFNFTFDAATRKLTLDFGSVLQDLSTYQFTFSELLLPQYAGEA